VNLETKLCYKNYTSIHETTNVGWVGGTQNCSETRTLSHCSKLCAGSTTPSILPSSERAPVAASRSSTTREASGCERLGRSWEGISPRLDEVRVGGRVGEEALVNSFPHIWGVLPQFYPHGDITPQFPLMGTFPF
jgi:hypothetical protein